MPQMIKMANWLIEVNADKTREYYNNNLKVCSCLYCNNFVEASKFFKTSVLDVFRKLAINPEKPAHLSEFPTEEDRIRTYMGNYHLVGEVLGGELCTFSNFNETNTIKIENFTFGFSGDLEFVPEDFSSPIVQLNFVAEIPWVLDKIPDE